MSEAFIPDWVLAVVGRLVIEREAATRRSGELEDALRSLRLADEKAPDA